MIIQRSKSLTCPPFGVGELAARTIVLLKPDDQRRQSREDDESPQERVRREPERGAHAAQYTVQVIELIGTAIHSDLRSTMQNPDSRTPGEVEVSTA